MSEVLTVHEWEAVLLERARPADLLPGETIARYVHRKFEALIKERDRLQRHLDETNAELEGMI